MSDEFPKRIYFFGKELQLPGILEPTLREKEASIHCFSHPQDCLAQLSERPCDLFIIDLDGCEAIGLDILAEVRRMAPWVSSLALVEHASVRSAVRAIKAGACDCLEKPVQEERLIRAIEGQLKRRDTPAAHGRKALTNMEIQVLQLILGGKTSHDIALELHRSKRTIDVHRKNIMRKLEASSPVDLIRRAMGMGFLDAPDENTSL
jgi:two-component system response regulator FixJ